MTRGFATVLVLGLVCASPGHSQDASPVRDLLATARERFNDLRFSEADSIARLVRTLPSLRRADRIQALQVSAGALYPEQEAARDAAAATVALQELIRIAPNAGIPRELSWEGLEALYRDVFRSTFGAAAYPQASNLLTGPNAEAAVTVAATRPAVWRMALQNGEEQAEVAVDSLPVAERGVLRLIVLRDSALVVNPGEYLLRITATDPSSGETLAMSYPVVVQAPPLELLEVPSALDSAALLPEVTKPKRKEGIIAGVAVAAATMLAATVARDSEIKGLVPRDSRAVTVGLAMGLGAAGGVWLLDKGAAIPKNIQANQELRTQFAINQSAIRAANQERLGAYRATVTITTEPR